MAVVSAGSLCAGALELPKGISRQYNVIELADNLQSAKIHVREMMASGIFGKSPHILGGATSPVELDWSPLRDAVGQPIDLSVRRMEQAIETAEAEFHCENPLAAIESLLPLKDSLDGYGRRLLLRSAQELQDWKLILDFLDPPQSIEELTLIVKAAVQTNEFEVAESALAEFESALDMPDPNREDLRDLIKRERRLSK